MPTDQRTRTAFTFGPFRLDVKDLVLRRGDAEIPLTRKAVETLLVLVENAGHVMGKETLLERVWPGTFVNESTVQYDAKFDGKDYPTIGFPYGDTVSVKRIGANTLQATIKKGGQVVMTVTSKVSTDEKTRTSTFKGKDAQGRDVNNVVVCDKQ